MSLPKSKPTHIEKCASLREWLIMHGGNEVMSWGNDQQNMSYP